MGNRIYRPGTRGCYVCKKIKPIEEFCIKRSSSMGRAYMCKPCGRNDSSTRGAKQTKNPVYKEYRRRVIRDKSRRNRLIVISHYGGICKCCGESRMEFLGVDHANGNGRQHKISLGVSTRGFYRWIIKERFPTFLRLLCHNCNLSRGFYKYCPHERERAAISSPLPI